MLKEITFFLRKALLKKVAKGSQTYRNISHEIDFVRMKPT